MFNPHHTRLPPIEPGKESQKIPSLGVSPNQIQHGIGAINSSDNDLYPSPFDNAIVTIVSNIFLDYREIMYLGVNKFYVLSVY
jgi:hypothetical protein